MPSQKLLRDRFYYEPVTGTLRNRTAQYFQTIIGNEAGGPKNALGYRSVGIDGAYYDYHRLVWIFHNGPIPPGGEIDHIDHNPRNNAIENLRLTDTKGNCRNRRKNRNNTTGYPGVYLEHGKWSARIGFNKKVIRLGNFSRLDDAIGARKLAEAKYGFHPNHGAPAVI